ncbi:MAG: acylneuraminate cytidylyltransferase family protein [Alphaproteobacteria bacterium]
MKALGIIPARGGSKGIPGKNIRPVGGLPLLAHSILAAQQSRALHRFVVSTDDAEIAATARRYGAAIVDRPAALASDDSPVDGAILHAIDAAGADCDTICLLQPTTPLRQGADIDAALDLFAKGNCDAVVGLVSVGSTHPARMYRADGEFLTPLQAEPAGRQRQALPEVFIRNGAVYICSVAHLRATKSLLGPRIRGYVMPPERSVNIDEEVDLVVAEYWFQKLTAQT